LKRILYIDDDPALGRLVQRHLERQGFAVELRTEAGAGLAALATGDFAAVALDHYMPTQDGLATLAMIREMADPPPVVYVTGSDDSRLAVAALKAGAADYVIKDVSGEFLTLLGTALDNAIGQVILRRQRETAERDLAAALDRAERLAAQRAVLLQEINHRVANSLQLIASILQLHAADSSDPATRQAFDQARDRVLAVAAVHRGIYGSGEVGSVEVVQYVGQLVEDMQRAQSASEIVYLPPGDSFTLGLDRAVPLGIILSELVLNALKYAYPEGGGPIRVKLARAGDAAELVVEDDGVGITEGAVKGSGLGTRIVLAMAGNLGAVVDRDPGHPGTRVSVRFALQIDAPPVVQCAYRPQQAKIPAA
jgi:two-component sensor histidine kinase